MKKIMALMFREIKLTRKSIILNSILILSYITLMTIAVYFLKNNGITEKTINQLLESISLFPLIISVLIFGNTAGGNDITGTDINTGWLKYSYSLPVTPFERAAARFARIFIISSAAIAFSFVYYAVFCTLCGLPLRTESIVLTLILLDAVVFTRCISDFFTLRARDSADFKKQTEISGACTVLVLLIVMAFLIKSGGISLNEIFSGDDTSVLSDILSFLSADKLIWIIPLTVILYAADFAVMYYCMGKSYRTSGSIRKTVTEKSDLTVPHSDLSGMLYKEIIQNKHNILCITAMPFLVIAMAVLITAAASLRKEYEGGVVWITEIASSAGIRIASAAVGYLLTSGLLLNFFYGDNRKLWAYFIISAPDGIKRFLYTKYVMVFAMCGAYFTSSYFADCVYCTARWFIAGKEAPGLISVHIAVFFFMLLENAFAVPMIIRFGAKKGNIYNVIIFTLLAIAAAAVFILLPEDTRHNLISSLMKFVSSERIGDIAVLIMGIFPFIASGAYCLSYRISCRLFKEGVNEYDK